MGPVSSVDVSSIRLTVPSEYPTAPQPVSAEQAIEDLGLPTLARALAGEHLRERDAFAFLSGAVGDPEVIRYRQEVFRVFKERGGVRRTFAEVLPELWELHAFSAARSESSGPLQQTIWRLGELELFVSCVNKLLSGLKSEEHLESRALRQLTHQLEQRAAQEDFAAMQKELPKLREGLKRKKSVTVGINLDDKLRPVEATVLSINEERFHKQSLLHRVLGVNTPFTASTPILTTPVPGDFKFGRGSTVPLAPLFQEVEELLSSALRPVASKLARFVTVNADMLEGVRQDAAGFLAACDLAERFEQAGYTTCFPELLPQEERRSVFHGLYNPLLALASIEEERPEPVIANDISFDAEGHFFVLTGPNQGGKTTFTQALGIAHALAQCGLFAPASSCSLSPADRIETHFPAAERGPVDTGRLSEEAARLSEIVSAVTSESLVLLNESLASTGPHEASAIAEQLLQVFSLLGLRGVYATHLHELAARIPDMQLNRGLAPLIAEAHVKGGRAHRTFFIRRGWPAGLSYAHDIAEQYGLSFRHMTEALARRGVLPEQPADTPEDTRDTGASSYEGAQSSSQGSTETGAQERRGPGACDGHS